MYSYTKYLGNTCSYLVAKGVSYFLLSQKCHRNEHMHSRYKLVHGSISLLLLQGPLNNHYVIIHNYSAFYANCRIIPGFPVIAMTHRKHF